MEAVVYRIYTAFGGEFIMISLLGPKMAPSPPKDVPELLIYRGLPAIVQDFQYRPGSLEVTLFWTAPQNRLGMDSWRLFQGTEDNLILEIADRNTRQATIKVPGSSSAMFYVCAVSKFGREGPKLSVLAKTNSDLVVTSGTGGSTPGTSSPPDPDWQGQHSGGHYPVGRNPL